MIVTGTMMMIMMSKDIEQGRRISGTEAVTGLGVHSLRAQRMSNRESVHRGDFLLNLG